MTKNLDILVNSLHSVEPDSLVLTLCFYMDDFWQGSTTLIEASTYNRKLQHPYLSAQFPLRKYKPNFSKLL